MIRVRAERPNQLWITGDNDEFAHGNQAYPISIAFRAHQATYRIVTATYPKMCSTDTTGYTISSQGIRGYIFVMANLKFAYSLN
jgi:hypothetical protein